MSGGRAGDGREPDGLIGVYPTLSPLAALPRSRRTAFPFSEPGFVLTHLGRGAVWLALRTLGLGPGKRLAMPAYHCGSEVEAARLAGVELDFYRVDGELRVDQDDLRRAAEESDAAYVVSHFGFPMAEVEGGMVIEDAAHGLFSEDADGPLGSRGRAAIFSLRKSLGVPDGGALVLRDGSSVGSEGRAPGRRIARSVAALLAGRAALSAFGPMRRAASRLIARSSRADAAAHGGRLTETVIDEWDLTVEDMATAAARPARLTEWVLRGLDSERIRERRRRNYSVLAAELSELCPEPYRELPEGVCPLFFPVTAPDRSRAIVRLLERGVRAIEVWPVPHPMLDRERYSELEPVRRELLALPVHQDLEPRHMESVLAAAKRALA